MHDLLYPLYPPSISFIYHSGAPPPHPLEAIIRSSGLVVILAPPVGLTFGFLPRTPTNLILVSSLASGASPASPFLTIHFFVPKALSSSSTGGSLSNGRRLDSFGPLVEEAVDELFHLRLEGGVDSKLVVEDNLLTLAHTAAYTTLDLMRGSDTLISLLQTNSHTDTVAETVVLLSNLANDNKLIRGDFSTRHTRDHGVGAVSLDVTKEAIVGLLQAVRGLVHDVSVPERSHNARYHRLTKLTAKSHLVVSSLAHHLSHGLEAFDHDDVEQVSTRVAEVRADVVRDSLAHRGHGLVENGGDERHATTAAGTSLRTFLETGDVFACAVLDDLDDIALSDVVARAHLSIIIQVIAILVTLLSTKDKLTRRHVKLLLRLDHRQELDIVAHVANHHTAEKVLSIFGKDILLVNIGKGVSVSQSLHSTCGLGIAIDQLLCVFGRKSDGSVAVSETVTEAGDVDTEKLELCAHVGRLEGLGAVVCGLGEVEGDDLGHGYTRSNETVGHSPPAGAFSNGVDVWHACPHVVVDNNTASLTDLEICTPGKVVPWLNAYRKAHC
ncbi:hypothetical protein HG530_002288 [Fusarium avenaceum]|nr:hypothetical protein HG530_002288 [Fusarium avenaceum]